MNKPYLILICFVFLSCQNDNSKIAVQFKLPKELKEVSGIISSKDDMIWAVADSGNPNELYKLDKQGEIVHTIALSDLKNNDWEEITADAKGSLYVGDFGNNDNDRKDLAVYKVAQNDLDKSNAASTQKTAFYYPEQTDFPPKKKSLFYDCEAFFEMDGYFYLFTKNRSKDFDGTTFLYKVPNKEGNFAAEKIGEFKTCDTYNTCCITGAALSPDKKKMVLLSHSKIWLFEDFTADAFLDGKVTQLELDNYSQKEAICFLTDDTLLIADEKTKKIGGNVYKFSLPELKSKP